MKKIVVVLAVLMAFAIPTMAVPTVNFLSYTGPHGNGGGEFTLATTGVFDTPTTIQTFCMEQNEHISVPSGTYFAVVNDGAVNGGVGGQVPTGSDYDPLDFKTAWLYTHFIENDLDSLVAGYSYNDTASAIALQNAIWAIENEITPVSGLSQTLVDKATAAGWTTIGDVRVLNLYGSYTEEDGYANPKQDMLVLGPNVPVPGAFLLGGLGVACVGWVKRRRSL